MVRPRRDGSPSATPDRRKLTNFLVNSLLPRPTPYTVWDTTTRGFAVVVHASGNKTWKAIYSRNGRPRWFHLGDTSTTDLSEARKLAAKIRLKADAGEDPQAEKRAKRSGGTFRDLADRYLEYSKKKNKSWKHADALVRTYLMPKWANLRAADISRSDAKAMMAVIKAPIVANQVLASASAIFSWAIRDEVAGIEKNPCHGVEKNPTKSRERILSDSEVPLFWKAFDDAGLMRGAALKMILLTGQRPGEVAHMRTEHIRDGFWEMPGEPVPALGWPGTKNAQSHRVWLPKAAIDIIAEIEPEGFVFTNARGSAIDTLDRAMRDICKALDVDRAVPHDLRRTHGSTITSLGFGRDAMDRVQNHRDHSIASVYDRYEYADEDRRIMESAANKILAVAEGRRPTNVVGLRTKK